MGLLEQSSSLLKFWHIFLIVLQKVGLFKLGYGLNAYSPPRFTGWSSSLKGKVLEGGAFGRGLGLVGLMPVSGERERKPATWGHSRKADTCKPRRDWTGWHLDLGILRLQNGERIHFGCLRPQAMGVCSGSLGRLRQTLPHFCDLR